MKFSCICCGLFAKKKSLTSDVERDLRLDEEQRKLVRPYLTKTRNEQSESGIAMAIQSRDKYQLILTQEHLTSFGRSFSQEPLSALSPVEQDMPEQKLPAEFERRVR